MALALRHGVARGLFSNEAGLGSAPLVHSASTTDHPVRQGLYGIFEVFIDTIVICTVTGLAILATGVWNGGATGAALSGEAFRQGLLGTWGNLIVTTSKHCVIRLFDCDRLELLRRDCNRVFGGHARGRPLSTGLVGFSLPGCDRLPPAHLEHCRYTEWPDGRAKPNLGTSIDTATVTPAKGVLFSKVDAAQFSTSNNWLYLIVNVRPAPVGLNSPMP